MERRLEQVWLMLEMGYIPNNAETQSQCRRWAWERFPGAETSALMGKLESRMSSLSTAGSEIQGKP